MLMHKTTGIYRGEANLQIRSHYWNPALCALLSVFYQSLSKVLITTPFTKSRTLDIDKHLFAKC